MTTALTLEAPVNVPTTEPPEASLAEALWQAWISLELPEGYRAEIIEESIEVSPTGRFRHAAVSNRLRRALEDCLPTPHVVYTDVNVIHDLQVFIPDLLIAPEDDKAELTADGLGLDVSCVELVVEVVSPGRASTVRDRERKRAAYARAGIPVYVLIDDHDIHGTVSILTSPSPTEAVYQASTRVPYGKEAAIPEGAAKGFVITEAITGPARD
ncbi:hypothetical protein SUDANB171_00836 [Streptomyces sp. enrichment culture]|uniref:Uma2 family endonuclease n=1 Tax=Streptomyces sp. enrichment culture TaxID=1795815 RepID=UPI003F54E132